MSLPLITLPDAEEAVAKHLRTAQAVAVGTRNPAGEQAEFVRVRRIGGTAVSRAVDVPTLDILVWANTAARRMDIARDVRARLHAAAGTVVEVTDGVVVLGGCRELLGPRRMPDPADRDAEVVMFSVSLAMR